MRDVSQLTGIATTTIMRMEQGRRANTENVIALSRWLNAPIETVSKSTPEDVPQAINTILLADPKLQPDQRKALCSIVSVLYRQMTNGG